MGKIAHITDIYNQNISEVIESTNVFVVERPISIRRFLKENGMENRHKECCLLMQDLKTKEYILQSDWGKRKIRKNDQFALIEHPSGFDPVTWGIIISAVLAVASIAIALTMPIPEIGSSNRQEAASVYNLNGHNNAFKLGQVIEVPYGRNRLWPSYAAKPYNKYVDNDQWLYSLFCLGQGIYNIESIQIEDTPISNFTDVTYQIYKPGESVTLFPDNVVTSSEISNVELFGSNESEYTGFIGGVVTNDVGTTTNYIEVDLILPQGLYTINSENKEDFASVNALFEYREIDDGNTPIGSWQTLFTFARTLKTVDPQRFTIGTNVPVGRYEVRGKRTNQANTNISAQDSLFWESLRAFLPSTKNYGNVTLLAVAARATNNLNSSSANRINVIATRKLDIWNGVQWQTGVATRSLVWAYCDIFRSVYGANLSDTYLDLPSLLELDRYFSEIGVTFDWVFDNSTTVWEAAATVARAGMAIPIMNGTLISMTADKKLEIPTAVFSKENIIQGTFSEEFSLYDESEYDSVEIEYIDGVTFAKETILCKVDDDLGVHPQTIQINGVSDVTIAYRWGMRIRSQQRKLRKNFTFQTGLEGNIPNYGDLIYLSHDSAALGYSGTIQAIEGNVIYTDKTIEFESGKSYQVGLRKKNGEPLGPYDCYGNGKTNQIVVNGSIDVSSLKLDAESNNAHWFLGPTDNFAGICKVVSITPSDGENVTMRVVEYDETVYDADDTTESGLPDGIFSGGTNGTGGNASDYIPDLPYVYAISVIEVVGELQTAQATWSSSLGAQYFIVQKSLDGLSWQQLGITYTNSIKFKYTSGYQYIRVAGVNVGQGLWSSWYGKLGQGATDFPYLYSPDVVRQEIQALDDFEQYANQRTDELTAYADQISDRLNAEVDDLIATIQLNDAGYGATFAEIRQVVETVNGLLALQIEGIASKAAENEAAVLQVSTALTNEELARAEQYQIITTNFTNIFGSLSGHSEAINYNRSEIGRIDNNIQVTGTQLNSLTTELRNNYSTTITVNQAIDIVDQKITAPVSGISDRLEAQNTRLQSVETRWGDDAYAKSQALFDSFIKVDIFGNVYASAGYRLKVDAGGVISGMEAIAKNDPDSPPLSILKFFANTVYYQLGTNLYRMIEGYPVAQQVGGWTSGDSYWKFRNFFSPQLVKINPATGVIDTSVYGETAGVKVYPVPESQPIDPPSFPSGYQPDLN